MGKNNGSINNSTGCSSKSRMGRQKIEIKKITNEEARQVCFSKRRNGLIKKAGELCILCGAEIAIIVFSPAGKAFSYGDPSVDAVINRFLDPSSHVPAPPDALQASTIDELNRQHDELVQQIESEKKRRVLLQTLHRRDGHGRMGSYFWEADVNNLSLEQLEELRGALEEMRSALANRANELTMGMAAMHLPAAVDHHHQFPPLPLPPPPYAPVNSSTASLPSSSFLGGYNANSMTIPFTNNDRAFLGASNSSGTMTIPFANNDRPFLGASNSSGTMANSGDYVLTNQITEPWRTPATMSLLTGFPAGHSFRFDDFSY